MSLPPRHQPPRPALELVVNLRRRQSGFKMTFEVRPRAARDYSTVLCAARAVSSVAVAHVLVLSPVGSSARPP